VDNKPDQTEHDPNDSLTSQHVERGLDVRSQMSTSHRCEAGFWMLTDVANLAAVLAGMESSLAMPIS
jgi:hypothetical protein